MSSLSPRVCHQGLACGAAREPMLWGEGSLSLVLPDSGLRSVSVCQSLWVLHVCPSCYLFSAVYLSHNHTAWSYDCIWLCLQGLAHPSCSPNPGGKGYEKEWDTQGLIQKQRDRQEPRGDPGDKGWGDRTGQGHIASPVPKTKPELEGGGGSTLSLCTGFWPPSFSLPLQECVSTFIVPKNSPLY